MDDILCLTKTFEGVSLPFFNYKGGLATPLKHLGQRLGYARHGARLVTNVMEDWSKEFLEGKHWLRISGSELSALKAMYGVDTETVSSATPQMILLLEPGIHLVLLKTNKPIGLRLRDFLATEVMPQLLRTHQYRPQTTPSHGPEQIVLPFAVGKVVPFPRPANRPMPSVALEREQRLTEQQAHRQRVFRYHALRELLKLLQATGEIDDKTRLAFEVAATEIALDRELPGLRPQVEAWFSPTQIAGMARVSLQAVGRAISALGLRGRPGMSRSVLTRVPDQDRVVPTWIYTQEAVAQILDVLAGAEPPKAA